MYMRKYEHHGFSLQSQENPGEMSIGSMSYEVLALLWILSSVVQTGNTI
jgi:hypothetical protein